MSGNNVSRRKFLKSGTAAAGISLLPQGLLRGAGQDGETQPEPARSCQYPNAGKIVIVEHPNVVLGFNNVDENAAQGMFDQGIMSLAGIYTSPADALASFFPGLTTSKKIAIKPNFLNSVVPTRKELTKAVITRLVQMLGGFPASNIMVYERHSFSSVGYTTSYFGQPVNLVFDSSFPNLGYTIRCDGKDRPYSKSLHDADYLINMPVLKDHSCGSSLNLTLSFKNHMGTVNPGGSLGIHCNKNAVLDIMASSVMTTKQRLVILDALYAVYNGGPGGSPQATPQKILLSQDPVAIDSQGRLMINSLRTAQGLSAKNATYIDEAAAAPYSLGIANPALMQVINVYVPVELSAFSATLAGAEIRLNWTTESESGNAGFAVERSTNGASDWRELHFVPGAGDSTARRHYEYADSPGALLRQHPSLFYRLRQVDYDGRQQYGPVAEVRIHGDAASWRLDQNYPNPFTGNTDIGVSMPRATHLLVQVFDMRGALVTTLCEQHMPAGSHYFTLAASGLAAGSYICRAAAEGSVREIQMQLVR